MVEHERDAMLDVKVLRGHMDGDSHDRVLGSETKTVIIFLCLRDQEKRALIFSDVVPFVQEFAGLYNLEFRVVDLCHGIRDASSRLHQVCLNSILFSVTCLAAVACMLH